MSSELDQATIFRQGMSGDLESWLKVNLDAVGTPDGRTGLAPFPPKALMEVTTGLVEPLHFAQHGVHFIEELEKSSPTPLADFESILDFGCGVGRLARLFKGFKGKYTGVDVDGRTVDWVRDALPYVSANQSTPRLPLPFEDGQFDCVISISVFTHMTEEDQFFYLKELKRVTRPGAVLLLTIHGKRTVERSLTEDFIFDLLWCPRDELEDAKRSLENGSGFKFILHAGHLTSDEYDYGQTFINERYIRKEWGKFFDVVGISSGAIHDFQDIVALRRS